jgi:ABC-type glutathione transport system ATPase component
MIDVTRPVLSLDRVSVAHGGKYNRKVVLADISLEIAPGETIGIIGESGSGKTTLARAILGASPLAGGSIHFEGHDLAQQKRAEKKRFRRSGAIQYIFQDPLGSFDPQWSVLQSIEEPLLLKGEHARELRIQAVMDAADKVHLDRDLLYKFPGQLSGGQRQRAAIARALVTAPRLLIADEPVSALDAATRAQILELLADLRSRTRIAQIFISHDLGSVAFLVDRVVVLYDGEIVETGAPAEIINRPRHDYTRKLIDAVPRLRRAA